MPAPNPDELPEIVLSVTVSVPPAGASSMPPPPLDAVLPEIVLSVTVAVPLFQV